MQCIVCVYSLVLTVCAVPLLKTNSIFELIFAIDFMTFFFHLNANFTLMLRKRLLGDFVPLPGLRSWTQLVSHAMSLPNRGDGSTVDASPMEEEDEGGHTLVKYSRLDITSYHLMPSLFNDDVPSRFVDHAL